LTALREKERRLSELQLRVGLLSRAEFKRAEAAALRLKEQVELDRPLVLDPELMETAARILPEFVDAFRREALVRSPEYAELVKAGKAEPRLPWQRRKKLCELFTREVGGSGNWGLTNPFDDLNERDMPAAVDAVRQANASGLGSLKKEQRLLILKAGATGFFEDKLKAETAPAQSGANPTQPKRP
jgi:hypothetical protein